MTSRTPSDPIQSAGEWLFHGFAQLASYTSGGPPLPVSEEENPPPTLFQSPPSDLVRKAVEDTKETVTYQAEKSSDQPELRAQPSRSLKERFTDMVFSAILMRETDDEGDPNPQNASSEDLFPELPSQALVVAHAAPLQPEPRPPDEAQSNENSLWRFAKDTVLFIPNVVAIPRLLREIGEEAKRELPTIVADAKQTIGNASHLLTNPGDALHDMVSGAVQGVFSAGRATLSGQPAPLRIQGPVIKEEAGEQPKPSIALDHDQAPLPLPALVDSPYVPSRSSPSPSESKWNEREKEKEQEHVSSLPVSQSAYVPPPHSEYWDAKGKAKDTESRRIPSSPAASPQSWWGPLLSTVLTLASGYGADGLIFFLDEFDRRNPTFRTTFPQGHAIVEEARNVLKTGKGNPDVILQAAWEKLKELQQFHVHWGFGVLSPSPILDNDEEGQTAHRSNIAPIRDVAACRKAYREIRDQFGLQLPDGETAVKSDQEKASPSVSDKAALEKAEQETGQLIEQFCHKTLHYSVIRTIYTIFGEEEISATPELIFKNAEEKGVPIKEEFLVQYSSIHGFFFRILYNVLLWFIRPLIMETTQQAMTDLRRFLKEDPQLIDTKLTELNDYLGKISVHNYVTEYCNPNLEKKAGSFNEFLKRKLTTYGSNDFEKPELIQLFQDFVIENYVPRPEFKIYRWRVILISPLLEWIVQLIRKQAVRQFLNQSHLIDGMIQQGGNAVFQAKINLVKLFQEKLEDINKRIEDSFLGGEEGEQARLELEAKKAALNPDLRILIQNLSANLLDFIKVEACNNNPNKIDALYRAYHNPTFVQTAVKGIANTFQQPESIDGILELALNHMFETAFVTFLEDLNIRAESQVQNLFKALNDAYKPKQQTNAAIYNRDYSEAKDNLRIALEKPITAALQATLEDKLKTSSPERHKKIMKSVEDEKSVLLERADQLFQVTEILRNTIAQEGYISRNIQGELEGAVGLIDQYLTHMLTYLNTPELAGIYYADTRANIYHAHTLIINHLTELAQHVKQIAQANALIAQCENLIAAQNDLFFSGSHDVLSFNNKTKEVKAKIGQLITDTETRQSIEKQLDNLKKFNHRLAIVKRHQDLMGQRQELIVKHQSLEAELRGVQPGYFGALRYQNAQMAEFQRLSREIGRLDEALNKNYNDKLRSIESEQKKIAKTVESLDAVSRDVEHLAALSLQYQESFSRGYRSEIRAERIRLAGEITSLVNKLNTLEDATVGKLVQGMGLKTDGKEIAREVYRFCHEGEGLSKFNESLLACKDEQHLKQERLQRRLVKIQGKIGKDTPELLKGREERLQGEITRHVEGYNASIQGCISASMEQHARLKNEIAEIAPQFALTASTIKEHVDRFFTVHDFIDMTGEFIFDTSTPIVQEKIYPEIQNKILTIVSALGKSFHYEQLGLRLLMVGIAERQYEKIRPR